MANDFNELEVQHGKGWLRYFVAEDWRARTKDIFSHVFLKGYAIIEEAGDNMRAENEQVQDMASSLLYACLEGYEKEIVLPECTCDEWESGLAKLNGPVVLQQLRAGKQFSADHFTAFKFCPWCGNKVRQSKS